MDIKDLGGVSEPLTKLLAVFAEGVGGVFKPTLTKRNAKAKAEELRLMSEAKADEIVAISNAIKQSRDNGIDINVNVDGLTVRSHSQQEMTINSSTLDRAKERINYQEEKRQSNLENIALKAVGELDNEETVSEEPLDEDWVPRFFEYAKDVSKDEMQDIWAKILADEVKSPNTYSLRTLDTLRNMSKEDAELFIKYANYAISYQNRDFILNILDEHEFRKKYDFEFSDILLLEEIGLIASSTSLTLTLTDVDNSYFKNNDSIVVYKKTKSDVPTRVTVFPLSRSGKDLLSLSKSKSNIDFLQMLAKQLGRKSGLIKYATIFEERSDGNISHGEWQDIPFTAEEERLITTKFDASQLNL